MTLPRRSETLTGPQLHAMYRVELRKQGCESDPHRYLSQMDKKAWAALARRLQVKEGKR